MKIQKSQLITIGLILLTVFLIGAIIYIGAQLSNENPQQSENVSIKTKAQSTNYNKVVTVNNNIKAQDTNLSNSVVPSPTSILVPTAKIISPTEILLAQSSTSSTLLPTASPSAALTPTHMATVSGIISPTGSKTLPRTGTITDSLFVFGSAGLLVFFSLIF
jgi:hypothetical protein